MNEHGSNTAPSSLGEPLMSRSTSNAAVCCFNASDSCSNASLRSRASRASSVSLPGAEELLERATFRVFALRLRALASLLLALERRHIAVPKAQDYAIAKNRLQQGFATGEMGSGVELHRSNPELPMAALGQKRTSRLVEGMSALPPKADIGLLTQVPPLFE